MFDVVPCPTPTRATTDATPMITPSIVRAARRRPVRRRENASRISSRILMPRAARRGCAPGGRPTAATSASWVISTIVLPARLSSRSSSRTSWPEAWSRLPVGSSARISAGIGDQRPGDGHALLLAAGQLRRLVVDAVAEAEPLERRRRAARPLGAPDALVEQRRRDVLERGRPRQQVVGLEHEPDRPAPDAGEAVVVEILDRRPGEPVRARRWAGRGSRRCSSSCSCPSPDGPTIARNSPRWTSRSTVAQRRHGDVAHVVGAADAAQADDRLGVSVAAVTA